MKKVMLLILAGLSPWAAHSFQEKCLLTHGIMSPNPNDFPNYWHLRYEKGPRSCFIIFTDEEKSALLSHLQKYDATLPARDSFISAQGSLYKAQMGVERSRGYATLTVGELRAKLMNPTYSAIEE